MTRYLRIDDAALIAVPEQPSLSPDGRTVAYVLRTLDVDGDRDLRAIWQVSLDGGEARQVTEGPADTAPAWSPDGDRLAFLRVSDGVGQIWLMHAEGEAEPVTGLPLGGGPPVWSPDGSRLAFTAATATVVADENAPISATRLDYYVDGQGMRRGRRRHIHVVELGSGACVQLTAGDWDAGTPDFSPDGRMIAFSAAMDADADLTRLSAAYVVDADGGAPRRVGSSAGWAGPVSWTADGAALLVAGSHGPPNGHIRLLRVPVAAGEAEDLAAELDRNVMFGSPGYPGATPRTASDGSVLFCLRDRGCTHLYRIRGDEGPRALVAGDPRNVSGLSISGNRAAFILSTDKTFGEVATVNLDDATCTVHTDHASRLAELRLHPRREREFETRDGKVVHGWLMLGETAATPAPLLVDIHGGPHNAWNGVADEVHLYHQELVSRGWAVLLLNPRGSDGYGEEFFTAVYGRWGIADAFDFIDPIASLAREGVVDHDRVAVTGYSYGGYMTCYLTSRHPQFAAAVAGGLLSDLTSTAGTTDNRRGLSESEFGGRPWEDRENYRQMSPIESVESVTAPTLILHGEEDVRCPLGQAQQWHTALRELGVTTEIVLYPGGSHTFIINGRPSHRLDYNRRVRDWVTAHIGD